MNKGITQEMRVCVNPTCKKEYEAHIANVLGIRILFGQGYCPQCSQQKLEEEERREAEKRIMGVKVKRELWRQTCGIPLRFQGSRFGNFDTKVDRSIVKMLKECQGYAGEFSFRRPHSSKSLVMLSPLVWGVGKTHLACSLAHALLDRWDGETGSCPVHFVSEPQLFKRIRATFNRQEGGETEEDIYKHLTSVPLLILDDAGKEEVADPRFVQRVLFAIIDGRYQNMLPLVMTANLDTDGLDRHLGGDRGNSASMDRLVEMTGGVFWELSGRSYRDATNRMPGKKA